ncbi:PepSY-associated TM helix domain-containing protein [Marinomonas sp. A79]|uniref:PepSY-associated TM helix domain-containing protein n=1 Tax=Marinomonas vulgaris TaxID=2823372 RepID=A0ABS5HFG5_9GAMM|nr:PepSY-associated TM helix domain-containing protein [Marinomonas vulgaris]MBR7889769.1 PepSY-associated TM helix domain-containing protein [Marinomonas vulgaris]
MTTFNRWARWVHIYSAAPVLLLMVFFAGTGLFLNHSNWSLGQTQESDLSLPLPTDLMSLDWDHESSTTALAVLHWLDHEHQVRGVDLSFEWESEEKLLLLYLDGPQGSYAVEAYYEEASAEVYRRQLPVLEMLNNLHRGKHVSGLWRWLSDLSALCMVLFCLSGFWLLTINTLKRRHSLSWVGIGSVVMVFTIFLMH